MNRASLQMRSVARQLVAFQIPASISAEVDNPAAFRAVEKLGPHFSMMMGRGGFQALLSRALVLAAAEVPWLNTVRVVADGELDGLTVAHERSDADNFSQGEVVLLAHLLGLLVAFIGPALTLRLIKQIWPHLVFSDTDLSNPADHGKAE